MNAVLALFSVAPEGVKQEVMELFGGSGSIVSVCSSHGLIVGSCLSLGSCLLSSRGLTGAWSALLASRPALLYIEPPFAAGF